MLAQLLRAIFPGPIETDRHGRHPSHLPSGPIGPPALPPPRKRYVLYRVQRELYDLMDDGNLVGHIFLSEGDEEHDTFWEAKAYAAAFDRFRSLKAAKEWLGNPPVRSYR